MQLYSTYLGGSLADAGSAITVDPSGNAYVTGSTVSTDFPTTSAVFQSKYGGGNEDAFVTAVNSTGSTLVYSTYLGGSNTESGTGIAVDTDTPPSAYVTGQTCSPDFPLANPLHASPGGNCDGFVSKVAILQGIALNPGGLVFPALSIGTTSAPQPVTLTNGDNPQTISSIAITGTDTLDFTETNTCGTSLAPGVQCTLTVVFTPTVSGVRKASITVTDSAPGTPQVVTLTGSTSSVTLSASSLSFGKQPVRVASTPQTVTVTNQGTEPLTISNVTASGDYAQTNNCSVPLQPTTNCVISVTYTPSVEGSNNGALAITDNVPDSPQIVRLTGTGVLEPMVTLSPSSLSFGKQPVRVASTPQTVTVTNQGTEPLTISSVTASGDYAQTNNCSVPLQPTTNCVISVTYTPSVEGSSNGALAITDNMPDSPQIAPLTGTGVLEPVVTLSSTSLTFANQAVGIASAPQQVTVENVGSGPLDISSIVPSGDFTATDTCGKALAVKATCTITVGFTPSAAGARTGLLTITDNAPDSPEVVSLGGNGADFALSATPSSPSVVAGDSVGITLTVTPSFGFNAKVSFTCTGAPATATCSVSPGTVTPDGTSPAAATVTVVTATRSVIPPRSGPGINWPHVFMGITSRWLAVIFILILLSGLAVARRRRPLMRLTLVTGVVLLWAACGGGNQVRVPNGTPAGSYTLTLTATSGTVTHKATANLIVR